MNYSSLKICFTFWHKSKVRKSKIFLSHRFWGVTKKTLKMLFFFNVMVHSKIFEKAWTWFWLLYYHFREKKKKKLLLKGVPAMTRACLWVSECFPYCFIGLVNMSVFITVLFGRQSLEGKPRIQPVRYWHHCIPVIADIHRPRGRMELLTVGVLFMWR